MQNILEFGDLITADASTIETSGEDLPAVFRMEVIFKEDVEALGATNIVRVKASVPADMNLSVADIRQRMKQEAARVLRRAIGEFEN